LLCIVEAENECTAIGNSTGKVIAAARRRGYQRDAERRCNRGNHSSLGPCFADIAEACTSNDFRSSNTKESLRETGFSHPRRPDDGDQASPAGVDILDASEILGAPDEARPLGRQLANDIRRSRRFRFHPTSASIEEGPTLVKLGVTPSRGGRDAASRRFELKTSWGELT
jgi:hypothetical protein